MRMTGMDQDKFYGKTYEAFLVCCPEGTHEDQRNGNDSARMAADGLK